MLSSEPQPRCEVGELGRYLNWRPRKDGSGRVLLIVPARLRPSGWPSTITIFNGFRSDDADEAIRQKAKRINERLDLDRAIEVGQLEKEPRHRDIQAALKIWQQSDPWEEKAHNTVANYTAKVKPLIKWSTLAGRPNFSEITKASARELINAYRDVPHQAHGILWAAKKLSAIAIEEEWIEKDPFRGIKVKLPKSLVSLWTQHDVDIYVEAATSVKLESIARLILIEWELGQRISDVVRFRRGKEYDQTKGCFRFWQQKTQTYLELPIRAEIQEDLAQNNDLYLIIDELTGGPFKGRDEWGRSFDKVRSFAIENLEGRHLQLRQLRHSVVVDMARNGCTIAEIAAVTGHTISRTTGILDVYLPRDSVVARNAMAKRWNMA